MLATVLIGFAGALVMFAGDMLLYYTPKDFRYAPNCSAEERISAIIDVMRSLPAKRVMAGGMLGPVAAFLYCVGFYHIVLMTNERIDQVLSIEASDQLWRKATAKLGSVQTRI